MFFSKSKERVVEHLENELVKHYKKYIIFFIEANNRDLNYIMGKMPKTCAEFGYEKAREVSKLGMRGNSTFVEIAWLHAESLLFAIICDRQDIVNKAWSGDGEIEDKVKSLSKALFVELEKLYQDYYNDETDDEIYLGSISGSELDELYQKYRK